jgi:hypothetical protein
LGREGQEMNGGSCRGYGWSATLELISPPIGKPVDSRQTIWMTICPACRCVHEIGGKCLLSRHRHPSIPANPSFAGNMLPLGLFFQSQFFSELNTTTFSPSSPVVGSTAVGNKESGELNARTIQQLVAANLTLAAAWTWIQELMTANDTGNVTSFPLVVTDEIYTLGFDQMVLNVLPNMIVENSGNSSMPQPAIRDQGFWGNIWNSFTGMLEAAWNAVVAVIKWCIDFAVAIANGQGLEFFYNTVVKPFVEAMMAFVMWIIDLAVTVFKAVFQGFINGLMSLVRPWVAAVLSTIQLIFDSAIANETVTEGRLSAAFSSAPFFALAALAFCLGLLLTMFLPFAFIMAAIIGAVVVVIAAEMWLKMGASAPPSGNLPDFSMCSSIDDMLATALDEQGGISPKFGFDFTREMGGVVYGLILGMLSLGLGIAAASKALEGWAGFVIGVGSFLLVFVTGGLVAQLNPGTASLAQLFEIAFTIGGIISALFGVAVADGGFKVLALIALAFAGLAGVEALFGWPL